MCPARLIRGTLNKKKKGHRIFGSWHRVAAPVHLNTVLTFGQFGRAWGGASYKKLLNLTKSIDAKNTGFKNTGFKIPGLMFIWGTLNKKKKGHRICSWHRAAAPVQLITVLTFGQFGGAWGGASHKTLLNLDKSTKVKNTGFENTRFYFSCVGLARLIGGSKNEKLGMPKSRKSHCRRRWGCLVVAVLHKAAASTGMSRTVTATGMLFVARKRASRIATRGLEEDFKKSYAWPGRGLPEQLRMAQKKASKQFLAARKRAQKKTDSWYHKSNFPDYAIRPRNTILH